MTPNLQRGAWPGWHQVNCCATPLFLLMAVLAGFGSVAGKSDVSTEGRPEIDAVVAGVLHREDKEVVWKHMRSSPIASGCVRVAVVSQASPARRVVASLDITTGTLALRLATHGFDDPSQVREHLDALQSRYRTDWERGSATILVLPAKDRIEMLGLWDAFSRADPEYLWMIPEARNDWKTGHEQHTPLSEAERRVFQLFLDLGGLACTPEVNVSRDPCQ